jgi:hypothetical protein
MSRETIVAQVDQTVRRLLAGRHAHQLNVFVLLVSGVVLAGEVSLAAIGARVVRPGGRAPSLERRFQRFVANPRVVHTAWCRQISRLLLAHWRGGLRLVLDETVIGKETVPRPGKPAVHTGRLVVVKVGVVWRGRCLPLYWYCAKPKGARARRTAALLRLVAGALPPETPVILMCDRGLSSPALLDLCRRLHWSFLLRVNGNGRVRRADRQVAWLADLVPTPGSRWFGTADVYKEAGWRTCQIVALWRVGCADPLILLTDRPATLQRAREYFDRTTIEQTFRDLKSHAWNWQKSRIPQPDHMARLLLALVIALYFVMNIGSHVIKRGWRTLFERVDRRVYSLCRLGLLWLARDQARTRPFSLSFYHEPLRS